MTGDPEVKICPKWSKIWIASSRFFCPVTYTLIQLLEIFKVSLLKRVLGLLEI